MESRDISNHLKPHILPPLTARGNLDSGQANHLNANFDKGVRKRIGTPAPNKKSPIPDDLDLNNLNISKGNPSIKVDCFKMDEGQRNSISCEKLMKLIPEGNPGSKNINLDFRLKKKPQLKPIVSIPDVGRIHEDLNGNGVRLGLTSEKINLPNKYAPLKPITKKRIHFDENVTNI